MTELIRVFVVDQKGAEHFGYVDRAAKFGDSEVELFDDAYGVVALCTIRNPMALVHLEIFDNLIEAR